MVEQPVIFITGTSKGIGKYLADHYCERGFCVVGCSRTPADKSHKNYLHFCMDVSDETKVKEIFVEISRTYGRLDILVNNAGMAGAASMNPMILTPLSMIEKIYQSNVFGTFLCSREAAKLMQKRKWGRIVNFVSAATPLKLEGESAYASSKAAIASLTEIFAVELAQFGITVNAIGPTHIRADSTESIQERKINDLVRRQAVQRLGEFRDVSNVLDFFIRPESDFVTGQILYLGGVS